MSRLRLPSYYKTVGGSIKSRHSFEATRPSQHYKHKTTMPRYTSVKSAKTFQEERERRVKRTLALQTFLEKNQVASVPTTDSLDTTVTGYKVGDVLLCYNPHRAYTIRHIAKSTITIEKMNIVLDTSKGYQCGVVDRKLVGGSGEFYKVQNKANKDGNLRISTTPLIKFTTPYDLRTVTV